MIYSKPNYSIGVWASNGNVFSPTSEKVELGHVVEKPKNEVMNWIQNRQDVGIAYTLQNGLPEWDSTTEYPIEAYVKYDGVVYKSLSQNIDEQPDIETGIWSIAFSSYQDYLDLLSEINSIKDTDGYLTHYVRKSSPIMSAKCNGTSYTANVGLDITGSDNVGYTFNSQLSDGLFHNGTAPLIQKDGEVVAIFEPPLTSGENSKRVVTMDILRQELQMYKVGDLYLTIGNENPSVRLGYGTWVRYAQGKALVGVSDVSTDTPAWTKFPQSEFGEYDHVLSIPEMPAHDHTMLGGGGDEGSLNYIDTTSQLNTNTKSTEMTGGGLAHNNVQPSITVNIWLRTL